MRVLPVEDDPMIGDAIQGALKDASYAADQVECIVFPLVFEMDRS